MYLEELGEAVKRLVIPGKEGGHGAVEVAGAELHVDLLVHLLLRHFAVVHPDPAAAAAGRRHLA